MQNWILPSVKVLSVPSSSAHFQEARPIREWPSPHPVTPGPLNTCVHSSLSSLGLESKTSLQKDFWGKEENYIVTTTIMKSCGGVNKMERPLLPCEDGDHFLSSRRDVEYLGLSLTVPEAT